MNSPFLRQKNSKFLSVFSVAVIVATVKAFACPSEFYTKDGQNDYVALVLI
jgi:hypothetical protein